MHPYLPSLSHEAAFSDPCGVATDSNGDLYVAPYGENVVKVYDPSGAPLTEFPTSANAEGPCGLAVDSSGNVYVNGWGTDVVKYKPSTSFPPTASTTYSADTSIGGGSGQLVSSGANAVAVDPANQHVYVSEGGHIASYESDGSLISDEIGKQLAEEKGASYYGLGVLGRNGDIYVADVSHEKVYVLNPTGTEILVEIDGSESTEGAFGPNETRYLAVDQSNGHVFVGDVQAHGVVDEFDAAGYFVSQLSRAFEDSLPTAIAVDSSSANKGTVYVTSGVATDGSGGVYAFGPLTGGSGAPAPTVTIDDPSSIEAFSARISGTVDPQGTAATWRVEYTTDPACAGGYAQAPGHAIPAGGSGPVDVSQNLELMPSQHYCARIRASNENGSAVSEAKQFTTAPGPPPPTVSIDEPSSVIDTDAWISGLLNGYGQFTNWRLETSTDPACANGFSTYRSGALQKGEEEHFEFDLGPLAPNTHHCLRMTAESRSGRTASDVKQFTTSRSAPQAAFVAPRLDRSARLNARVNPEGEDLVYRFEYSADGGESWQALPSRTDTSHGTESVLVSEELSGLQPGTAYSFRLHTENGGGSQTSDALSFTTRSTGEMTPPQRGIELVNAPDKGNANVVAGGGMADASLPLSTPDGEKVLWTVRTGTPGGSNSVDPPFLAQRTSQGWRSTSLAPPAAQQLGEGDFIYSLSLGTPDFSRFAFGVKNSLISILAQAVVRLDDSQHQELLGSFPKGVTLFRGDMTDDGAHVLLVDDESEELEDIGGGAAEVISVLPEGAPARCRFGGFRQIGTSQPETYGFEGGPMWRYGYHMFDVGTASRVYFVARPNDDCSGPRGIYLRDRETNETTLIDPGVKEAEVEFLRATPDGRTAYFVTNSRLEPADENHGADVYRWNEESGSAVCLSCVVPHADVELAMVSDDFSHVYFQSKDQLVPGAGRPGQMNIYVLSGGEVRFVAAPNRSEPLRRERATLSSDGNVLVFSTAGNGENARSDLTTDSLPGGGQQCLGKSGGTGPCAELYRYDDRDGSLECISCNHDGATQKSFGAPEIATPDAFDFRTSGDGSTVLFATEEALLRGDVNGGPDLYQWRGGSRSLITDGVTSYAHGFATPKALGVDATGRNLFFAVASPGLTGYEHDNLSNLYDARVGGGFPRPAPAVHCSEESCQGPLQAEPPSEPPASAGFRGLGNVTPAHRRCPRARRVGHRGRCHARHKHRRHRARAGDGGTK